MVIELTGEKIYGEFDPRDLGAQRSSFIPPGSDAGDTVTTIAIIDPNRDESHNRVHAAGHGIHVQSLVSGNGPPVGSGSGFGHGPAIPEPISLSEGRARGLTSRNESAPPIPRDLVGTPSPSRPGMSPEIGNRNNNESAAPPVKALDEKIDGPSHDLPNPVNPILISGLEPQPLGGQSQITTHESTVPPASTFGPHLAATVFSKDLSCVTRGILIGEEIEGDVWRWGTSGRCYPCFRDEGEGVQAQ